MVNSSHTVPVLTQDWPLHDLWGQNQPMMQFYFAHSDPDELKQGVV